MRTFHFIAIAILSVASYAHAETYVIDAPGGWQSQAELGKGISKRALVEEHVGGGEFQATAVAWVKPGEGALYVTSILASSPSKSPERDARSELDLLRATIRSAGPTSSVELVSWKEATVDGIVGASLHWKHLSNETETIARILVYADKAGRLRVFRAECVLSSDASEQQSAECRKAVESLSVAADKASRVAISDLPPAVEENDDRAAIDLEARKLEPLPGTRSEISGPGTDQRKPLYRAPPKSEESSHRWLFLGGGLILVVAFYLTSRARTPQSGDEDEAEEEPQSLHEEADEADEARAKAKDDTDEAEGAEDGEDEAEEEDETS